MNNFFSRDASSRGVCIPARNGWRCAALLAACAVVGSPFARAQNPGEGLLYTEHYELGGDPRHGQYFGYFVAVDDDTLVVSTGSNKRVLIYTRGAIGWALQQQLDVPYHDQTSGYLALDGDTLVAGGVIYTRSGGVWTQQHAIDATNDDPRFALQGDTLVYGDPYPTNPSQNQDGNVKVFVRNGTTWTQQATLSPSFLSRENMGYTVALDGNTLLAGIHTASQGPGGAYVYVRNGTTWTQETRLVLPTGAAWMSVALEGDTAAIGDPGNNLIHVFTRSGTTWTLSQSLALPPNAGNYLGDEIAISGGIIAASAQDTIHLYSRTPSGWIHAQSFPWPGSAFPSLALANRGKLLAHGSFTENSDGFSATGAARVHRVPPPPAPGSGWRDADIDYVGVAGSSVDNGTTVTVSGSGSDIWDRVDQFHFRSESLTGDGAIIARIDSAGSGHPWAKAGLMFREDIAPSAKAYMALVTPGSHLGAQARLGSADTTGFQDAGWLGAPIWLMLVRSGDLFASYYSFDGEAWTAMGSVTMSLPATIHAGLAVSSHDNTALNTGTFSSVEIVSSEPPPPPPGGLSGRDLGAVGVAGAYSEAEGTITIDASGADIWQTADSGYFAQRELVGDFDVRVRVASLANTHPWAKAGLMVRESYDPGARNVFVLVTADNVAGVQARSVDNGETSFTGGPWVRAPYWVRLVRSGNTITGMISADGTTWQTIAVNTTAMSRPQVSVGLAVTSHDNTRATRATFTNLQFSP